MWRQPMFNIALFPAVTQPPIEGDSHPKKHAKQELDQTNP
jgi:hypothetical protein